MLDGNNVKNISFSWEEGHFFDLWMIVHLLTGLTIGFGAYVLGIDQAVSYWGTLAGLSLYEVVEEIFNIDETIENRVTDIVFGMIGFVLTYSFIASFFESSVNTVLFILSLLFASGMSFLGWRSYKKRGS